MPEPQQQPAEPPKFEQSQQPERPQQQNVEQSKQPTEPQPDEPQKPRYLDNPLPLPKKHEKRGDMEFPHEVSIDDMHYDRDVVDWDDFDL